MNRRIRSVQLTGTIPALLLAAVLAAAWSSAVAATGLEERAPSAGLLQDPDVSATHIAFRWADDLWLVPREGGVATPLVSPPGAEWRPRFSPDGAQIAFVASYDGDLDLYTVPVAGGVPRRVTHQPSWQMLSDWTPDGRLLYSVEGSSGVIGRAELYTVAATGGMPQRVPVPHGSEASMSADGRWLAYIPMDPGWSQGWKRYVGGSATDIWMVDLEAPGSEGQVITDWNGTDLHPMWHGDTLYYLSDAGPAHRLNLWAWDRDSGERRQLTFYEDLDVRSPSIGPGSDGGGEIVFIVGDELRLLDLVDGSERVVDVRISAAREQLRPRWVDVSDAVGLFDPGPAGKRVAVEARGDIWTVPAEHGTPRNLTRTDGVAERYPAWSPDGRWIAYFSDRSGEYELHVIPSDGSGEERQVTSGHQTFFYPPTWSPDSEHLVFQEKTGDLWLCKVSDGKLEKLATDPWPSTRPSGRRSLSWSPDSRWIAFDLSEPAIDGIHSLWLYDVQEGKRHRITGPMADEQRPVFGRDGDFLFYVAQRAFEPTGSAVEFAFVYRDTEVLMAAPLRGDVERPFAATTDEEEWTAEKDDQGGDDGTNGDQEDGDEVLTVEIELDGLEERAYKLPVAPGSFQGLSVASDGKLVYVRLSGGDVDDEPAVVLLDPSSEDGEEKVVASGLREIVLSADGSVLAGRGAGSKAPLLLPVEPDAKASEPVMTGMLARIDPRREWRQLFDDTGRLFRDYFYDPGMHGVDWEAVRDRYAALLPSCAARSDLSFLIRQMIGELNVGHARYSDPPGGDNGAPGVGMLGVEFELTDDAYRFATIYRGPTWEPGLHSPLLASGVDVKEGEYLLAVNGVSVDPEQDPWAAFVGLEDQEVVLTVGASPERDDSARDVVVKTRSNGWERNLRYRAWVEANRRYVDEASDGRVGYVHVPNYMAEGLTMLITQYYPQQGMEAMIIDQRFNGGGWTPHRFLEILNRPPIGYRARRDGRDRPVPGQAHFGPKCLLMNEHSGSSGDMFPWMFRDADLGPLIGRRTWGGVVGLSGNPGLIDGSQPVVPNNGTYSVDGEWVVEGWGVEPDIAVPDRPVHGTDVPDATLDVAIETMLEMLEGPHFKAPEPPPGPDRSGMGVPENER